MTIRFEQREETYLGKARYDTPKEVFKVIGDLIDSYDMSKEPRSFLDVGCATGELIYYLKQRFPRIVFTGIDYKSVFVETASRVSGLEDVEFQVADAIKYRAGPYHIVTCLGVLGVFDDFEPLLESLIANCFPGGRVFVQALFNDYDIDVRVTYRDNKNRQPWNKGFNIFSVDRVSQWLQQRSESHVFHPFVPPIDVPHNSDFPHRAWSIKLGNGSRQLTNGLNMLLPEKILEIRL